MEPGEEPRPADDGRSGRDSNRDRDRYDDRSRDLPRRRSRSRERFDDRSRDRDVDRDRRRDRDDGGRRAEHAADVAPAGSAKQSVRRYHRRGPTQWDVKPAGWIEGMEAPSTLAPPPPGSGHGHGSVTPTQQTRHARRVYVGGLEAVPEREIAELFAAIITATLITPLPAEVNPVLSVYINPERKFAFVEVATIELATALMALDGMTYKGQSLKIRRPHDYRPELLHPELRDKAEPLNLAALGQVGLGGNGQGGMGGGGGGGGGAGMGGTGIGTTGNRDSLYRIFVGGIPSGIDEYALAELMGAFGEIKHLHIVRGPDGSHKGYGFCEYVDPAQTDIAVASLNGLSLGDRTITVSRAKGGPPTTTTGGAGAGAGAGPMGGLDPAAVAAAMGLGGAGRPAPQISAAQPPLSSQTPTRVVCLEHMVDPAELGDDAEYRDICEDIAEEAGKHGTMQLQIPRPPAPAAGRVFLHYSSLDAAVSAATAMAGRKFGSKTIVATYYDEAAFAAGNLTA